LAAKGYEVAPVILPACAVNAPHRRDRVWFVANTNTNRKPIKTEVERESKIGSEKWREIRNEHISMGNTNIQSTPNTTVKRSQEREQVRGWEDEEKKRTGLVPKPERLSDTKITPDTERKRQQEQGKPGRSLHTKENSEWKASWAYDDGRWPTQSPVCSGDDGLPPGLDGFTLSKWREEQIKAYGNAIVPQVAFEILKAINKTLEVSMLIINDKL